MIPIDFQHIPSGPKLSPKASATFLKNMPENTALIGRIRKDAKLYAVPGANPGARGRRRVYGDPLPTPEQLRQDDSVPWQHVEATACGKKHEFRVKTLDAVRWKAAGDQTLRLLVIAPLRYQKTKTAKPLYRQPAYIICTDPAIPLAELLQAYIWRWDIEVNFRDEKTVLGVGQAQVRTPATTQKVPAFQALAYSLASAPRRRKSVWRREAARPTAASPVAQTR